MAHHKLKADAESYRLLALHISSVQLRKNDRGFLAGDTVSFYEWNGTILTGHVINPVKIITLLEKHPGLAPGWCLLVVDLPGSYINTFKPEVCGLAEVPGE